MTRLGIDDNIDSRPGRPATSSLAAVAAGLRDAGTLIGDSAAPAMASRLVDRITGPDHTVAGSVRYPVDTGVDGSLLWIGVPFGLIAVETDLHRTTVLRIRQELHRRGGGVRRHQGDAFYGGSQGILLAASSGWSSLALATANSRWRSTPALNLRLTTTGTCPNRWQTTCSRLTCSPTGGHAGAQRYPVALAG